MTLTITGTGAGTISDGTSSVTFSEIERLIPAPTNNLVTSTPDAGGPEIIAAAGADTITGGSGADTIKVGHGNDSSLGGAGSDTLAAGDGTDLPTTGAGDVTIVWMRASSIARPEVRVFCRRHADPDTRRRRPGGVSAPRRPGHYPRQGSAAGSPGGGKPVLIRPGAFGLEQALIVSPQHGLLLENEGEERLIRMTHLARMEGGKVRFIEGCRSVTYLHLLFERHVVVFSNSLASESLYPGPVGVAGLDDPARADLAAVFPMLVEARNRRETERLYSASARSYS